MWVCDVFSLQKGEKQDWEYSVNIGKSLSLDGQWLFSLGKPFSQPQHKFAPERNLLSVHTEEGRFKVMSSRSFLWKGKNVANRNYFVQCHHAFNKQKELNEGCLLAMSPCVYFSRKEKEFKSVHQYPKPFFSIFINDFFQAKKYFKVQCLGKN